MLERVDEVIEQLDGEGIAPVGVVGDFAQNEVSSRAAASVAARVRFDGFVRVGPEGYVANIRR